MNHLFITRLAVEITGKARPLKSRYKVYTTIESRLNDIIDYWKKHASKFYTSQTVDANFKVHLVYSTKYTDVVKSHNYPPWCQLVIDKHLDRLGNKRIFAPYQDKPISVTRVDADDWYSNNLFEYLQSDHDSTYGDYLAVHLYKNIRVYDRLTGRISRPVYFKSPGFCSYTVPRFSFARSPLAIKMWPHGNIKKNPHIEVLDDYCIQSVGSNVVNKWRPHYEVECNIGDKFYIPSDFLEST